MSLLIGDHQIEPVNELSESGCPSTPANMGYI
jgi:hypothetical protein